MKNLKITTGNPATLKSEINDKIAGNKIRSWQVDDTGMYLSHKGDQYLNHFYFEYKVDKNKGILEFVYHSSKTSDFADSKAYQLLERMLNSHFGDKIEIL